MSTGIKPLCLACSSSPSPKADSTAFFTPCCSRTICDRCLEKNPRLRWYNPCLACLAGVALVGQSSSLKGKVTACIPTHGPSGRSQDQEDSIFVLGDSDEEDRDDRSVPPPYSGNEDADNIIQSNPEVPLNSTVGVASPTNATYYIQPHDTLRGIALKFGVDGVKICQLNSLPLSALSTTPHILHTRRVLILPPGKRIPPPTPHPSVVEAHERERAEKRFQFVTKEVDWRVAKAYVAIAEGDSASVNAKDKEDPKFIEKMGGTLSSAVERYLEDDEWEAEQSSGPSIQGFPLIAEDGKQRPKRNTASIEQ
ncbi:hypothetical protein BU17DRAFT_53511 [Hysterangium stoloniferum]|nr:hypothetical protein BU17DRAFT_53511 [Hysterangium stoloniferum]